jgi:hypothetical protein
MRFYNQVPLNAKGDLGGCPKLGQEGDVVDPMPALAGLTFDDDFRNFTGFNSLFFKPNFPGLNRTKVGLKPKSTCPFPGSALPFESH